MRRALALLVAPAVAGTASAQTLSEPMARRIDAVYAKYSAPSAPGCVVGVYQDGRIVYARGYGSANIEYDAPITPQTPFIMGSVSKQFTAAAIALLIEDGRIKATDDVRKYIPELHDYGKTITIDHLVHHTSGLRDFWTLVQAADMRNDDGYDAGDVLRLAARQRHLNFEPGAEYNYSNTGYVLLGIVVQRVTGRTLREFAAERIFGPLGMTHSHFHDDHTEPDRGRASAYVPAKDGGWKIDVWNNDIVGQGGLMTTVEDLQKWDENFYTGKVGGQAFRAAAPAGRVERRQEADVRVRPAGARVSRRADGRAHWIDGRLSHRHRALSSAAYQRGHDVQCEHGEFRRPGARRG